MAPRTAPGIHLLGTPALDAGAGREPFAPGRPYQLLAYLACRGAWVTRDVAATLLWPDRDTSTARANLRFVLVQVRRLPHIEGFETRADALRWTVDTDLRRFESAVAASDWTTAIDGYAGPLLDGFEADAPVPFVEWLQGERARVAALWHAALTARLAELHDNPAACSSLAVHALQADPLDETALAAYLHALSALGRGDEARRAYRDYAQRLANELAIEPSAALRETMRRLDPARAGPAVAPAAAPVAAPAGLVGRRIELGRLHAWLRNDEFRALVVTGAGGVGKSSLARAALATFAGVMPGGAFWIALDDLRTIDQVATRCAMVLDFDLRGTETPERQLQERLRAARALLVFDNAEHLTGIGPWLEALLTACASVKVIVTSRVRLDLPFEQLLPLAGLPVPDAEEREIKVLRAYDAVRLFEVRALREHPDFDVVAFAADVAALVRTVEGLPLAIELAAAWVRLLPVSELRRELEQSLDLLDSRDAGRRHGYSVRGSFEHSWGLLAPAEQQALARLAVFRGNFSRESARAVADAALPLLAALADKSLLHATDRGRFAFHPLIQQFALEKLAQAGADENAAAHERHAAHFLALLARFENFQALDQRAALQAIDVEIENMIAAWRWAVAQRRVDLIEHCAAVLENYMDARGQLQFGLDLLNQAAAVIDETLPAHQFARCHVQLARAAFHFWRGDYPEGEGLARAALQSARRIKYRFGVQSSTNTLGLMLWHLGRTKEAASCLRDALRRARADGDSVWIPLYAMNLGRVELEHGNYDEGEQLLREALDATRRNGNLEASISALTELCHIQFDQGRPEAVPPIANEGLALCESSGFQRIAPYFHRSLADACFALGDLEASAVHARVAVEAIRAGGDRALEPVCLVRLARIALRTGDTAGAWSELHAAAKLAQATSSPRIQLPVVSGYAHYCIERGDLPRARALLALVIRHPAATRRLRKAAADDLAAIPVPAAGPEPEPGTVTNAELEHALYPLLAERP